MYPIDQFFAERGGKFTSMDLRYLAMYGLKRLIEDSIPNDDAYPKPEQDESFEPAAENPEPPGDGAEFVPFKSKVGRFTIMALGEPMSADVVNNLSAAAAMFTNRSAPRVMVLNPWVGEEILAIVQGLNNKSAEIFCCGSFDGNGSKWTLDVVDEVGPRNVLELFAQNMSQAGIDGLKLIQGDVVSTAEDMDPQELSFLVCPPLRDASELRSWLRHMRPDGVVCGWQDTGAVGQVLGEVGMRLQPSNAGSFWSFPVSAYRKAAEKAARATQA